MDKISKESIFRKFKKVRSMEYFVFLLVLAIIISLLGNVLKTNENETKTPSDNRQELQTPQAVRSFEDEQELRLKRALSSIKGAGSVEVMITYKSGKEIIPAMNTVKSNTDTEEQDANGGVRRVNQTDINTQPFSMNQSGDSEALILKEIEAEIQGVIVIAQGADDLKVRLELQRAVQTVLGLFANQVEVFIMDENSIKE